MSYNLGHSKVKFQVLYNCRTVSIIIIIIIMFAKCQLKAVDVRCFGIVSVNAGINQMPKNSHVLEPED